MVGWDGSANDDGMRGCVDEKVARVRRELPQGLKPLIEFFGEGKKEGNAEGAEGRRDHGESCGGLLFFDGAVF
jgi:hypothetical protein